MNLHGRAALVAGGAGHIGRTACETLAELGAAVAIVDIEGSRCAELATSLERDYAATWIGIEADLTDETSVQHVVGEVLENFGRLDIVVTCAALVGSSASLPGWAVPLPEQRPDSWRRALDVNLTSVFLLTRACAEPLARSGHGSVINLGSIYGIVGPDLRLYDDTAMGNPAAYAASKGGVVQLTRWLATVLAPAVRVNALSPGGVARGQPKVFQDRYRERTPLARMATEEDLRGAIAYLASDLSAYVTGHNLVVDGGWTAW